MHLQQELAVVQLLPSKQIKYIMIMIGEFEFSNSNEQEEMNMKRVTILFIIVILITMMSGCNTNLSDTSSMTSNQVDENSKIEQKLFTALVADYGMSGDPGVKLFMEIDYNKLSPIKTNTKYKKEDIDKTRSVEWNGKIYEVKYGYSSEIEVPCDFYIYQGNDDDMLFVYYIADTTNIYYIMQSNKSKIITNPLSEVEQKQIADKYISQYTDINDYLFETIEFARGNRMFIYSKPVNGIPSDDRYSVHIDGEGIIYTFIYYPQNVGKYDNINIDDNINNMWVIEKVTERINELCVNSKFKISNISMVNTILCSSDAGQKYIYCQAKFDCHDKNTQELYSTPYITFIILLD